MPANSGELRTLAILFAQYGVEAFLESTSALVVVLNEQGELLSCNASFEQWKRHMPDGKLLQDFLSAPSKLCSRSFSRVPFRSEHVGAQILNFSRITGPIFLACSSHCPIVKFCLLPNLSA